MNNDPLISILMSAHNAENTIKDAVRSIQTQTYNNLEIFIIDDNMDLSTNEIVKLMAKLSGLEPRLFKVPNVFLRLVFNLIGKKKVAESLMANLQVDSAYARNTLDWTPPFNPKLFINDFDQSFNDLDRR